MLREIRLRNFRCFNDQTVGFQRTTVIVGRNNSGKSTIVEALNLVAAVVNRRSATFTAAPSWLGLSKFQRVIAPGISHLNLNLSTAFHRYGEPPAEITASFENGAIVRVFVGREDTIYATVQAQKDWVTSSGQFVALSIPWIYVLPQVGPVQGEETLLTDPYVLDNLYTRLSSRHFRNQILRSPSGFADFKRLAEATWHGLRVEPVEKIRAKDTPLSMLVQDGDFAAEVGWMGHGLQMWLQTIWFVSRTPPAATVVLDEPDVYMHPDLQRKLFRLIRGRFEQAMIATHSVEIMAEADPGEILIVDKKHRRSGFANTEPGVQMLVDRLGGIHNVHLARLWNAKKVLLLEGEDLGLLRCFHELLFPDSETPLDAIPNLALGGWGGWSYAIGSSMALRNAVGEEIISYCILDSDYHTEAQKCDRYREAADRGIRLHIWSSKEIENYLLRPAVIRRLIKERLKSGPAPSADDISEEMLRICEMEKDNVMDGLAAEIQAGEKSLGMRAHRVAREQLKAPWGDPEKRLAIASGKAIVSQLSAWSQEQFGVSFGPAAIAKRFHAAEIPEEIKVVLEAIEEAQPFPDVQSPRGKPTTDGA
jgi:energy-coupling factor transporter ATP-binding protein EcfA2